MLFVTLFRREGDNTRQITTMAKRIGSTGRIGNANRRRVENANRRRVLGNLRLFRLRRAYYHGNERELVAVILEKLAVNGKRRVR